MFRTEFPIEWGDCDEAGIVFYPNYFYWLGLYLSAAYPGTWVESA